MSLTAAGASWGVSGSVPDSKRMRHGECLVVSLTEVGASWGVSGRVPDNREIRMDRGEQGLGC